MSRTDGRTAHIARTNSVKTGFQPRLAWLHRTYNFLIAAALIVMAAPLLFVISVALLLTQGRSIFYRGPRVGLDGRIFNIVKFRTLDGAKAASITSDRVLADGTGIETPLGKFLRDTRLDELPQLFNVLFGDMNMCGPRPVRPEMADLYRSRIPWFDIRFEVKPGLVGHSQAFMSHGTSELIRERYNAMLCRSRVSYFHEVGLLVLVGACVMARGATTFFDNLGRRLLRRPVLAPEARRARDLDVTFEPRSGARAIAVAGVDGARMILADPRGAQGCDAGWLVCRLPDGAVRRARIVLGARDLSAEGETSIAYAADGDFSAYILSRYLMSAVVVPHKSLLPIASLRRRVSRPRPAERKEIVHPSEVIDAEAA